MAKKKKTKKNKELVGYYYDGKKSWKLYKDNETGEETQELWKDKSDGNYDYSGIDHDKLLHNRFYK